MNKTFQGIAATFIVVWVCWVSATLWVMNEKMTRIESFLFPPRQAAGPHPQPDRLAAVPR